MNRFPHRRQTVTQEKTEDWIGPADAEAVAEIQKLFDQDSPWYRYLASCDFSQADLLNVSDLFGQETIQSCHLPRICGPVWRPWAIRMWKT